MVEEDLQDQLEGAICLLGALIYRLGGQVEFEDIELTHEYELKHTEAGDRMLVRARRINE